MQTTDQTMYDEYKLSNETRFKQRTDGGQVFSHHILTLQEKPELTNIRIEPHRAASLNNQAHNRLRIYIMQGTGIPQSIRRSKELTEEGFETGKWNDELQYKK